jgi:hypothetical protein
MSVSLRNREREAGRWREVERRENREDEGEKCVESRRGETEGRLR